MFAKFCERHLVGISKKRASQIQRIYLCWAPRRAARNFEEFLATLLHRLPEGGAGDPSAIGSGPSKRRRSAPGAWMAAQEEAGS